MMTAEHQAWYGQHPYDCCQACGNRLSRSRDGYVPCDCGVVCENCAGPLNSDGDCPKCVGADRWLYYGEDE